jgi:hypothetical protein
MQLQVTVGAEVVVAPLAHRTVRCATGQSGVPPDSPVNYSRLAPRIPEGEQFGVVTLQVSVRVMMGDLS